MTVGECRRQRGRRRLVGSEAEDQFPREQPGSADQGTQTAGQRQRGPALWTAQTGEATEGHHGASQGTRST